jgi:CRP-like cAMP-binding protein
MAEHQFQPREMIFQEGDEAHHAFILREGEVEILKHANSGEVKLATLKPGDVFGEMALFDKGTPRSATARAVIPSRVEVIASDEFDSLLAQCPPRILPFIHTVIERLRSSNARISQKEAPTVVLESDVQRITFKPATDSLTFSPVEVMVARLPFRIGGYAASKPASKSRQNHLNFSCEGTPLLVSRHHCQVEVIEGGLYMVDLGSRLTTIVNGHYIGRGKGIYRSPLKKGENIVTMGGTASPYKILIICE